MPSTQSTTISAPSLSLRPADTSSEKHGWPGVSIMLNIYDLPLLSGKRTVSGEHLRLISRSTSSLRLSVHLYSRLRSHSRGFPDYFGGLCVC